MERPSFEPPVRGEWKAIHNPFDTPHALDFIGLRAGKRLPYPSRSVLPHVFYRVPVESAFGWARPVYVPFEGEIIEARDGYPDTATMNIVRDVLRNVAFPPDLDEDIQRFAGNYVILEGEVGVAFMAHLRCDSVTVAAGDSVTAGEQLGTVGNTGASLLPHLHFQVLSQWPSDISLLAETDRPIRFSQFDRWNDGTWRTVRNRSPKSGDRIRVVE